MAVAWWVILNSPDLLCYIFSLFIDHFDISDDDDDDDDDMHLIHNPNDASSNGKETMLNLAFGANQPEDEKLDMPLYARSDQIGLHDLGDHSLPSHHYFNAGLGALRRKMGDTDSSKNPVLNRMVSLMEKNPIPILFPEPFLFPRIFWNSIPGAKSYAGAMPSFMFSNQKKIDFSEGLASLEDHLSVRSKDLLLPTARNIQYNHFSFDLRCNRSLKDTSATWLMNRGLAYVPEVCCNMIHFNSPYHSSFSLCLLIF